MASLNEHIKPLYEQDSSGWSYIAAQLATLSCEEEFESEVNASVEAMTKLTDMFNTLINNMDKQGLYVAEHMLLVLPKSARENVINYALAVGEEPYGDDNYMTNYAQYRSIHKECARFSEAYNKLPKHSKIFYQEAFRQYSEMLFQNVEIAADAYEGKITKPFNGWRFDFD